MHIPEGFIPPQVYIPADIVAGGLLYMIAKKVRIDSHQLPFIAALAALSFVFMMVAFPLPGGTSAHLEGVALMALLFGPMRATLAISLVLAVEAFLFGEGGVLVLGLNIISIAFVGSFVAYGIFSILRKSSENLAVFIATFLSIVTSSLTIGLFLSLGKIFGIEGFFPFEPKTTLAALLIPHLFVGVLEGMVTLFLYSYLKKRVSYEG